MSPAFRLECFPCWKSPPSALSQLSKSHFLDSVAPALGQKQICARPCWQNVLVQVDQVDAAPNRARRRLRLGVVEIGVLPEVAARVTEGGGAKAHATRGVPVLEKLLVGVAKDREVEAIRDEGNLLAVPRE